MSIGNGFCNISSDSPLGNVSVTGLGGKSFFSGVVHANSVCISLPKGFYILRILREREGKEKEKNLYVGY